MIQRIKNKFLIYNMYEQINVSWYINNIQDAIVLTVILSANHNKGS